MLGARQPVTWRLLGDQDLPTYLMEGVIGEDAAFEDLAGAIGQQVRFDLSGISRINSTGLREWLKFVRAISHLGPHRLARCPVLLVGHINLLHNFAIACVVESVMAPFYCEECDRERAVEIQIRDKQPLLPGVRCDECGLTMSMDEAIDRYFAFLAR